MAQDIFSHGSLQNLLEKRPTYFKFYLENIRNVLEDFYHNFPIAFPEAN